MRTFWRRRMWAARLGLLGTVVLPGWAPDARADADDHAAAQAIVSEVAADTAHAAITGELLDRARRELERAAGLRAAYDEKRARAADGAALEWAETARDVLRAVDAETKAGDVRKKALDAQAQVDRTRALVDEDTARIGRLKAQLANAEKENKTSPDPARRAVEVHEGEAPPKKKAPKKGGTEKPSASASKADATGGSP
jgi:hypothetical protein